VRTGGVLELFDKDVPFVIVAIKPLRVVHRAASEKRNCSGTGRSEVAGYDKDPRSGVRGKTAGPALPNCRCNKHRRVG
jgi:hypothetical protein